MLLFCQKGHFFKALLKFGLFKLNVISGMLQIRQGNLLFCVLI